MNTQEELKKEIARKSSLWGKLIGLFDRRKQVEYGDKFGKTEALPVINEKSGEAELHLRGEKYPLRGVPRHHFLHGPLVEFKRKMKNIVIETMTSQIEKMSEFKTPEEQWCPFVKELARVADLFIEAEDEPEMKRLAKQFRDPICMFLQEDDAWRFRIQWAIGKLNIKLCKLSKSDLYYFRAKSFKVD